MTRPAVLAEHIDRPEQRHRCAILDAQRIRCHDCDRTILITQPGQSTSTSKSVIPRPDDPRCPHHEHEHQDTCRACAADRKANENRQITHDPTADVPARAAEARKQLPARRATNNPPPADPERMAIARAELDAIRATTQPEPAADA